MLSGVAFNKGIVGEIRIMDCLQVGQAQLLFPPFTIKRLAGHMPLRD